MRDDSKEKKKKRGRGRGRERSFTIVKKDCIDFIWRTLFVPCVSILYATERMHFLITDATFHHALYFIPAGQILWLLELFVYIHRTKLV